MTDSKFKIGQRVREHRMDRVGHVVESNYAQYVAVKLDGMECRTYWWPTELELIEDTSEPAKPECYVTAWCSDGDEFSLTSSGSFKTKAAADHYAKCNAPDCPDGAIAVFKMVSKHSSAVTVTSEDV